MASKLYPSVRPKAHDVNGTKIAGIVGFPHSNLKYDSHMNQHVFDPGAARIGKIRLKGGKKLKDLI